MKFRKIQVVVILAVVLICRALFSQDLKDWRTLTYRQIANVTPYTVIDGDTVGPFMDSTFFFNRIGNPFFDVFAAFGQRGYTPNDYAGDSWSSAKTGARPKGILWIPATYPNDSTLTFATADSAVTTLDFRRGKFSVIGNSPQFRVGLASPLGLTGAVSNITGSIVTASNIVTATTASNNTEYLSIGMSGGNAVFNASRTGSGTTPSYSFNSLGTTQMHLSTVGNLGLGTTTFGSSAATVIGLANGTAPSTSPANLVQIYSEDISGSAELKVRDEAGNVTVLSDLATTIGGSSRQIQYNNSGAFAGHANLTWLTGNTPLTIDDSGEAEAEGTAIDNAFVQTTDATVTTIYTITSATDAGYLVEVHVVAAITTHATTAAYIRDAAFENDGGTLTQVGITSVGETFEDAGATTWDVTFAVSGTNILVQVTGQAATTINWQCTVIASALGE